MGKRGEVIQEDTGGRDREEGKGRETKKRHIRAFHRSKRGRK